MEKKYLNIGCGSFYSTKSVWTNVDFSSKDKHVIEHNLLQGIPFPDSSFVFAYHSHVLEHFSKSDGIKLLKECHRVLKSGGILRVAIPDLESIAKNYLTWMDQGLKDPNNEVIRANYNWMLLEMYDQTVRNTAGGEMSKYLLKDHIINEDFVFERIGREGRGIRENYLKNKDRLVPKAKKLVRRVFHALTSFRWFDRSESDYHTIGKFRLGGEIHQWMYDRYSLTHLLTTIGFQEIKVTDAFNSYLEDWNGYYLDGNEDGITRKPDSLYIEAKKLNS